MIYPLIDSWVDNSNNDGFAFFADFEYDGGDERYLLSIMPRQVMTISMHSGKIRVSDFSAFQTGSTTFATGRYRVMVRYDGTTLKAWMKPDGGTRTEEINTTAPSYTVTRAISDDAQIGGAFPGTSDSGLSDKPLMGKMYEGAYWKTQPTEAEALDLIDGSIGIGDVTQPPTWWPDPNDTARDQTSDVLSATLFGEARQLTAPTDPDNFRLLRDPETGIPVQYDAGAGLKYWGAYNHVTTAEVQLATSDDLETWANHSELFAGEGNGLRPSDFLYLGNISGSHDPFLLLTTSGAEGSGTESQIHARTSSDMVNWTFDLMSPMFTNTTLTAGGVEDFAVCRHGGSWIGAYEHDGLRDGTVAIGIAESTNTLPDSGWANVNDRAFTTPDKGFDTTDRFVANPVCLSRDGTFWLFYEGYDESGDTRTLPLTLMRKTTDPKSQTAWEEHGVVFYSLGRRCYPNSISWEGSLITLYLQNGVGATTVDGAEALGKVEYDTSYLLVE